MVNSLNNILQLKGKFESKANAQPPRTPKLPKNAYVTSNHVRILLNQLKDILAYWTQNTVIEGALISVHYKTIVAKSNRLHILLSYPGHFPVDSICGAKFKWEYNKDGQLIQKHVFTHYVPLIAIKKAISILENTADILDYKFNGKIDRACADEIDNKKTFEYRDRIAKTTFLKAIVDCWYVEKFDIDIVNEEIKEESIITIFKTNVKTKDLFNKLGINIFDDRILDDTTVRLNPDEIEILLNKAPYLISMNVTDMNEITKEDIGDEIKKEHISDKIIQSPNNEPIVGVIDTQFNKEVYFNEWVEYRNMLSPDIPLLPEDYYHGTAVTSIIVDGPRGNPQLDDGCGNFRVRHFGVATHGAFSSFAVLRNIRSIIASNRDIKVWNLSLGSNLEIKENSISPEAAELDRIQSEYDVIFIVAGTNKPSEKMKATMKIGAPADSLNSIVVNSVDFNKKAATYSRVGPVLSFFYKPDISYYGGDGVLKEDKIVACKDNCGASFVAGTSFAAPWITRKVAYLIYIMGLSKEVAKALIIDSAAGWQSKDGCSYDIGYGIVPQHINDIIYTKNDEIKFVLTGVADSYETYNYNLPVPTVNNAYPFYARATLAYFPHCNRNQGVDYTNTEMDIHFGRILIEKGKAKVKSIDNNKQGDEGLQAIYEADARKEYRKWDNVKHICEKITSRSRPRKTYETGVWGLSIKTKERLFNRKKDKLPFGVVVTLKEMNGVNRIDDFIKLCNARGWIVNKLDVQNQVNIYAKAEEDISFE